MKHAICITTSNDAQLLEASLSSLLSQLDTDETEVAVVETKSTDGSTEIPTRYDAPGKLRLVIRRCFVGMGCQLAFLNSKGGYVLAYPDTDDVFRQNPRKIIKQYHAAMEGMTVRGRDFLIVPGRHLCGSLLSRRSGTCVHGGVGRIRQGINHFGSGDVSSMSLPDVEASEKASSLIPARTTGMCQESVMVQIRQCQ